MKGQYKTQEGKIVTVLQFDEANKMVYVELHTGQNKWFTESEYATWKKEGEEELPEDSNYHIEEVSVVNEETPEVITDEVIIEEPEPIPSIEEEKLSGEISDELEEKVKSEEEQETISEVTTNPITEEKPRRKRTYKKKEK